MSEEEVKLPRLKVVHGCEDLFALRDGMLYFVFRGTAMPIDVLKGTDAKAVGMLGEAGWQRRSDWLWDRMLEFPSNKSKAYKKFEGQYDEADLQIAAWRHYAEERK